MSIADRIKYGVNIISMMKATKAVLNDPTFEGTSLRDLAEKVAEKILNKKVGDPGIDWDALIAFIEKFLPLILTIIDLLT